MFALFCYAVPNVLSGLFGLMLNVPVNSYGHVGMISLPNHTFSWTGLN